MRNRCINIVLVYMLACLWISAAPTHDVVINEISQTDSYLELRNRTGSEINIGGWVLVKAGAANSNITIPAGAIIEPNGYAVIQKGGTSVASGSGITVVTGQALDISTKTFVLKNSTGTDIDSLKYTNSAVTRERYEAGQYPSGLDALSGNVSDCHNYTGFSNVTISGISGTPGYKNSGLFKYSFYDVDPGVTNGNAQYDEIVVPAITSNTAVTLKASFYIDNPMYTKNVLTVPKYISNTVSLNIYKYEAEDKSDKVLITTAGGISFTGAFTGSAKAYLLIKHTFNNSTNVLKSGDKIYFEIDYMKKDGTYLGTGTTKGARIIGARDVVINEINIQKRYVELRNRTGKEINIGGWILENAGEANGALFKPVTIPSGTVIPAYGYLLLQKDNSPVVNYTDVSIVTGQALDFSVKKAVSLKTGAVSIDNIGITWYYKSAPAKTRERYQAENYPKGTDGTAGTAADWYNYTGFTETPVSGIEGTPGKKNSGLLKYSFFDIDPSAVNGNTQYDEIFISNTANNPAVKLKASFYIENPNNMKLSDYISNKVTYKIYKYSINDKSDKTLITSVDGISYTGTFTGTTKAYLLINHTFDNSANVLKSGDRIYFEIEYRKKEGTLIGKGETNGTRISTFDIWDIMDDDDGKDYDTVEFLKKSTGKYQLYARILQLPEPKVISAVYSVYKGSKYVTDAKNITIDVTKPDWNKKITTKPLGLANGQNYTIQVTLFFANGQQISKSTSGIKVVIQTLLLRAYKAVDKTEHIYSYDVSKKWYNTGGVPRDKNVYFEWELSANPNKGSWFSVNYLGIDLYNAGNKLPALTGSAIYNIVERVITEGTQKNLAVTYYSRKNVILASDTISLYIDDTAPAVSNAVNKKTDGADMYKDAGGKIWTRETTGAGISAELADGLSGLAKYTHSAYNAGTELNSKEVVVSGSSKTITDVLTGLALTENKTYTQEIKVYDNAENEAVATAGAFNVDITPPVISNLTNKKSTGVSLYTDAVNRQWSSETTVAAISADIGDTMSGLSKYTHELYSTTQAGISTQNLSGSTESIFSILSGILLDESVLYSQKLTVYDNVGNKSETFSGKWFTADISKPSDAAYFNNTRITTGSVIQATSGAISVIVRDTPRNNYFSGIKSIRMETTSPNGIVELTNVNSINNEEYTFLWNNFIIGNYGKIKFIISDNTGNENIIAYENIKIARTTGIKPSDYIVVVEVNGLKKKIKYKWDESKNAFIKTTVDSQQP